MSSLLPGVGVMDTSNSSATCPNRLVELEMRVDEGDGQVRYQGGVLSARPCCEAPI